MNAAKYGAGSLLAVWLVAMAAGFALLLRYEFRSGSQPEAFREWPAHTFLQRAKTGYSLIMFVHPRCPCSRASLEELSKLLAHAGGTISAEVVFWEPEEAGQADSGPWRQGALWRQAGALPGVTAREDAGGREAARFHAETSGDTFLYDQSGRLVFRGGITDARGHVGANAGRDSIETIVQHHAAPLASTPVYGCPLVENGGQAP